MPKARVSAQKSDKVDEPEVNEDAGVESQDPQTQTVDADADFTEEVQSNKEARDPFFVSTVDPTDPNGYNNAPREADGFIANPVAGGAAPTAAGDYDSVVNGITQVEEDVEDLPESNVDPKGVVKKFEAAAKRQKRGKSDE